MVTRVLRFCGTPLTKQGDPYLLFHVAGRPGTLVSRFEPGLGGRDAAPWTRSLVVGEYYLFPPDPGAEPTPATPADVVASRRGR